MGVEGERTMNETAKAFIVVGGILCLAGLALILYSETYSILWVSITIYPYRGYGVLLAIVGFAMFLGGLSTMNEKEPPLREAPQ
jgi:hypothetical protein